MQKGEEKYTKNAGYHKDEWVSRLDYRIAPHCIQGAKVSVYGRTQYSRKTITDAINKISKRQHGARGITILCRVESGDYQDILPIVAKCSGQEPIVYTNDDNEDKTGARNATEEEMKMWLRDRGTRHLVTDLSMSSGWEDSTIIGIHYGSDRGYVDNMYLRAVSNLTVIKYPDFNKRMTLT